MTLLTQAMPRTLSAAHHVRRHGWPPAARNRVDDLLQALTAVECQFVVGGPVGVPAELLRDLVIISALVGRAWLDACADQAAAFTSLHVSPAPPSLAELDDILATILERRFSSPAGSQHRCLAPVDQGSPRPMHAGR